MFMGSRESVVKVVSVIIHRHMMVTNPFVSTLERKQPVLLRNVTRESRYSVTFSVIYYGNADLLDRCLLEWTWVGSNLSVNAAWSFIPFLSYVSLDNTVWRWQIQGIFKKQAYETPVLPPIQLVHSASKYSHALPGIFFTFLENLLLCHNSFEA